MRHIVWTTKFYHTKSLSDKRHICKKVYNSAPSSNNIVKVLHPKKQLLLLYAVLVFYVYCHKLHTILKTIVITVGVTWRNELFPPLYQESTFWQYFHECISMQDTMVLYCLFSSNADTIIPIEILFVKKYIDFVKHVFSRSINRQQWVHKHIFYLYVYRINTSTMARPATSINGRTNNAHYLCQNSEN